MDASDGPINPGRYTGCDFPPYTYIPKKHPHPESADGHGQSYKDVVQLPTSPDDWLHQQWYLYGIDLFNHGFYWEAHEIWEQGWHAAGRRGVAADFLKGLIKLAAAGVKAREGRAAGVSRHSGRARELFQSVRQRLPQQQATWYGLGLDELSRAAEHWSNHSPTLVADGGGTAPRNLGMWLVPQRSAQDGMVRPRENGHAARSDVEVHESSIPLQVVSPSRLHFGLTAFGQPSEPSGLRLFGGVGVMLQRPNHELVIRPSDRFTVEGPEAERVRGFVAQWRRTCGWSQPPRCQIQIRAVIPAHVGLGSGTQLGLAVAAGLNQFCGAPLPMSAAALANAVGRGRRSAIGSYGFMHGGLIVDAGRRTRDPLGRLECQLAIPDAWRFVLIFPDEPAGHHGDAEKAAFARLPPPLEKITTTLQDEIHEQMLPALRRGDCHAFGESVFRYGKLAGSCFAPVQGGPFANAKVTALVERIRHCGVSGVGQSSWGPVVFAIVENATAAQRLIDQLQANGEGEGCEFLVTPASAQGASIGAAFECRK